MQEKDHEMNPDVLKAALDALESGDAAAMAEALRAMVTAMAAGAPPAEGGAEGEGMSGAADPKPPAAEQAAMAALLRVTGAAGPAEAVEKLTALDATVKRLEADREALEAAQRRELVGELVKLGVEFPSTAWDGDPKDLRPAARLAAEPLAELRGRVEKLRALVPAKSARAPEAKSDTDDDPEDVKAAAKLPENQRERFLALRRARRAS